MLVNFKIISQGPHLSERKLGHRLFPSSIIKYEITRYFHIVVVQGWQRNVQKSVLYMQNCCNLLLNKPIGFLTFQLPLPSYLLKLSIFDQYGRLQLPCTYAHHLPVWVGVVHSKILHKTGKSFIQPQVIPPLGRDNVSKPLKIF